MPLDVWRSEAIAQILLHIPLRGAFTLRPLDVSELPGVLDRWNEKPSAVRSRVNCQYRHPVRSLDITHAIMAESGTREMTSSRQP